MANAKSRIPPTALVIAIFLTALFGFQMLRSTLTAALKQKDLEIASLQEELSNVHKELLGQQQIISQLTGEKVRLATDTDGLKSQLVMLEKYKGSNDDNKRVLEDSLQSKEDELDELKEQLSKMEHSRENVEELRQQVRELEKKLKLSASETGAANSDGAGGDEDQNEQNEINLDRDAVEEEAEGKQSSSNSSSSSSSEEEADDADADLVDRNEHSDDGEQVALD